MFDTFLFNGHGPKMSERVVRTWTSAIFSLLTWCSQGFCPSVPVPCGSIETRNCRDLSPT